MGKYFSGTDEHLGLDSYCQDSHLFPIPRFTIGFNEGKVPATVYVDVNELGDGRVQVELPLKVDLDDVG